MQRSTKFRISSDIRNLVIALLIGLVHGLVYLFFIPPWQHYDEPNHFEYAWLISERGKLPAATDVDIQMRSETARSMIDNDFFRNIGFLPDPSDTSKPAWIGQYSQLSNPPLYYLIASFPLYFVGGMNIADQLITVRFVSLGFYLITLLAAWGITRELTAVKNPLRFYVPVTLALLPGIADVMTAVNNDVAAIAFVSICLWGCIHVIIHGTRILPVFTTVVFIIMCLFTKETAYVALILFLITTLFVLLGEKHRRLTWFLIGTGSAVGLVLVLSTGDAAYWYRSTAQESTTRSASPHTVIGSYVFSIDGSARNTPHWSTSIFQPLLVGPTESQNRGSYTLGAWIWADTPDEVSTLILGNGQKRISRRVKVGVEPAFFSYSVNSLGNKDEQI